MDPTTEAPEAPAEASGARLSLGTKLAYGFGSVSEGVKDVAFKTFLLFYYNQVLGLPGWMGGAAAAVALTCDAITDPLIGSISDATHSRWGRRHPFMYASALPMATCFYLLFHPPEGLSTWGLFAWLTVFAVLVRASMTLYSIPSNSMVAELTSHYDERTTLVSFRFLFGWAGGMLIALLAYLVFFAPTPEFENGLSNPEAYGGYALTGAIMIFVAILVCAIGTHPLIPHLKGVTTEGALTLGRFSGEIRAALSNPSYRTLIVGSLFASVAGAFGDVFGLYMNTYFWGFSTEQISALIPAAVIGVALGVALARPMSERFDKKSSVLAMASAAVTIGPIPVFARLAGLTPESGSSVLLLILAAHALFMVICAVTIGILISSMIADTVDENELATGMRQEGMFASAIAFSAKAATGVGTLLAGVALDIISFPRAEVGGQLPDVPPETVTRLGWIVGPGLMILWIVTLYFLSRYRLSRHDHAAILAEISQRKGQDGPTG